MSIIIKFKRYEKCQMLYKHMGGMHAAFYTLSVLKNKNGNDQMTKILVVEDEPLNMELMLELINSLGFTADCVENGEDAIKRTQKELYDLILMDIGLPGMDGVKATAMIKKNPMYKDVPAIAVTSYAMKGDRERLLAAGFDDYISKPIEIADFVERMKRYRK